MTIQKDMQNGPGDNVQFSREVQWVEAPLGGPQTAGAAVILPK